jgi:hypothetical protein
MAKWTGLEQPITAELADAEPLDQRLFGSSYDRRQARLRGLESTINRTTYEPWKKPRIERQKTT